MNIRLHKESIAVNEKKINVPVEIWVNNKSGQFIREDMKKVEIQKQCLISEFIKYM